MNFRPLFPEINELMLDHLTATRSNQFEEQRKSTVRNYYFDLRCMTRLVKIIQSKTLIVSLTPMWKIGEIAGYLIDLQESGCKQI